MFESHPYLHKVWVWDKHRSKYLSLVRLGLALRRVSFDLVINLHRFASSGILTALTGAPIKNGFDKNPLSQFFTQSFPHVIGEQQAGSYLHETERNQLLIEEWCGPEVALPRLYPEEIPVRPFWAETIGTFLNDKRLVLIAPASVWNTKQFPTEKWKELINELCEFRIGLIGAPSDIPLVEHLIDTSGHPDIHHFCGKLNLLESARLMREAVMTYVNDSAPLHLATAVQAPVTAVFCSTVPAFGFGPKGPDAHVVETKEMLSCRPCGLHGKKACPEGHFKCALTIEVDQLLEPLTHKKAH